MVNVNWLLIICVASPPAVEALNWSIKNDIPYLSEVTLFIVREHFSKFTSTVVITEYSLENDTNNVSTLLLDYLLLHIHGKLAVQLYIQIFKGPQWEYYIFIVDSVEAFRKLIWEFPMNFNERQFRFLIILTKYPPNFLKSMKIFFQLCYDFNVINANIIVDHPALGVSMFTYRLFSEKLCRVIQPQLYFRFDEGLQHLIDVFPEKLLNLYGCPMKVTSRMSGPMLLFSGNASNPQPIRYWDNLFGLEGVLLKLIAQNLNFTIEFLPFSDRDTCFSNIIGRRADVAIGSFSGSDPDRMNMSSSRVYHHTPYMFIVRSGRLLSSLGRLATPFNYSLWILIIFVLITGTVIILAVRCTNHSVRGFVFGERNDAPILNFVAVFLGYPIFRVPSRNFGRYLLMLWLLLTLHIRNAYQGSLYDAIRMNKFARTPSGLSDLIKWNYKMLLSPELARLAIVPQNVTTTVLKGTYVQRFQNLESMQGNYATLTLRDNYMHYMGRVYKNGSDLILINEVIYMYQVVMFFSKHSIFLNMFNKKLQAFIDSGIAPGTATYFSAEPAMFWSIKQKTPRKPLNNERLLAVYQIYACMTVIAVVVFALELLSIHSVRMHRIIDWIN